ncbi:MerR family transcriptional regulator [Micromonospora sp. CB01531]|uniref:MerR family transcriptional regulator n=1 Tax=Micromonospora sp. CB01531 TaxID=1718947 RepID=UPI0009F9F41D|nr:MerR family transcriptional regulator [Micromonospora sp. CB01531]
MTGPGLRSGQLADAAGVNLQTLRYYERRGLLASPQRSPGGHRLYPPDTVTLLRVIKTAQRLGFTLNEVADLLDAGRHRHGGRPDAGLQARARGRTRARRPNTAVTVRDLAVEWSVDEPVGSCFPQLLPRLSGVELLQSFGGPGPE